MSLVDTINSDIKDAMKAKNSDLLQGLRAIKSALLLAQTEKGSGGQVSEDTEIKILQRLVKQRKESLSIYQEQGRDDLASQESKEIDVIEQYLPKQLDESELEKVVQEIIQTMGASSMQDMGKVMGMANQKLAGKADGKRIADTVKRLLS